MLDYLDALNLVAVVISAIFLMGFRKMQYDVYDAINKNKQTEDDYAIFIEDIPVYPVIGGSGALWGDKGCLEKAFAGKIKEWLKDCDKFNESSEKKYKKRFI